MTAPPPFGSYKDITLFLKGNVKNIGFIWFFAGKNSMNSGILSPHWRGG